MIQRRAKVQVFTFPFHNIGNTYCYIYSIFSKYILIIEAFKIFFVN